MLKETGRFKAIDSNEQIYNIIEYTNYIDASTLSGKQFVEGLKELHTDNGLRVNRINDEEFCIAESGVSIRRV